MYQQHPVIHSISAGTGSMGGGHAIHITGKPWVFNFQLGPSCTSLDQPAIELALPRWQQPHAPMLGRQVGRMKDVHPLLATAC